MPHRLQLRVEPAVGQPYTRPIDQDAIVIGRSSKADLQIPDRSISRRHTRLFLAGDALLVEDLGSRNGTRINNHIIEGPTEVGPGDVIEAGGVRLVVERAPLGPGPLVPEDTGSEIQVLTDASSYMPQDPGEASGAEAPALRHYADRLKVMNDVHEVLSRSLSLDDLLSLILNRVFDHLRPQQAVILLRDAAGEYQPAARRSQGSGDELFYSRSLVREVGEGGKAALVLDTANDERFAQAQSILDYGVRSILAAPLMQGDRTLGMIVLSSSMNMRQYSEDDLALLVSLASVAAMRIRNVELLAEAAERHRLEEELSLARRIQQRLVPKKLPNLEGYQLFSKNVASRWVSGDFFTVAERDTGASRRECVLLVADVSGKGMAASLLAASLEALTAGPIEMGQPPGEICSRVSRRLYARTPIERYATSFVAVLDPDSGSITYCNAGHNAGLMVRSGGEVEMLGSTGRPLGLLPDESFSQAQTALGPGDTLILYTDGVTEATDPDDIEFGLERLVEVCGRPWASGLEELAAAIEEQLHRFVQGVPYADDQTLLMARRLATS